MAKDAIMCAPRVAADHPFALPPRLPARLEQLHGFWRGLLRGGAEMPFADDFRPGELPDLAHRVMLIDVLGNPVRFRLQSLGKALGPDDLTGRFLDETDLKPPLDYLDAQCSATVEAAAPTFFRSDAERPHQRLLLPFWGVGQIGLLLGAVDFV
jgi:hypothetical protein